MSSDTTARGTLTTRTDNPAGSLSGARAVRLAAAGMGLIAVCYGMGRFAYGLFVPSFRADFGLDATATGLIASGGYAAYCLAILAATAVTQAWGARRVATLAGILATLGTALIAWSPTGTVLAVGMALAGASTGLASPPLAQAVDRWVRSAERNRLQTVVNAGTGVGVLVSGPVALVAAEHWRIAWWAFAGAAAAVTVWTATAVPRDRTGGGPRRAGTVACSPAAAAAVASASPRGGGVAGRGRRRAWGRRAWGRPPGRGVLHLLVAAAVVGGASSAVWTFGPDLLTGEAGHGQDFTTVAWIVLGAGGLLGAATGDAMARYGRRAVWVVLMLALGVVTAGLAVGAPHPVVALAACAVFGGVYIALTGVLLLWGVQVVSDRPARGVGLAFLFLALGQTAAGPALGAVADGAGPVAAFWLAAGAALAGALIGPPGAARTPPREHRPASG